MHGLGKLLDDETKRESTVVRGGPEDAAGEGAGFGSGSGSAGFGSGSGSAGFGSGRDKTMTPAVGERGRSRTVTAVRNGEYQEIGEKTNSLID